jgi:hypothetical protein
VGGMMPTLKMLSTLFAKVQLWKQWNKLKDRFTTNMDNEELKIHRATLQLIQKDLQFIQANEVAVKGEDDEYNLYVL